MKPTETPTPIRDATTVLLLRAAEGDDPFEGELGEHP